MCGIAGFFSATSNISREVLQLMSGAIAHRGPDAEGFYYSPDSKIGLAHRRLSIIDLSTAANQPIFSASGRYAMIYNGEVYNFQSLQSKLPHFNWKTHSDTEVILELFEAHGPAVFSWLNGMFAIAIYDTETAALTIARDQLGIKPLFYYWNGTNFLYSSELKSIQQAGILDLKINRSAIPYFLHLGFIPQPMTIYEQVFKFPTAHYAVIDSNTITLEFHRFWNAEDYFLSSSTISEEAATKTYQKLLYSAVETQMISDVPLGTFLSGGIDSSLVTAVASKVSKQKIQTFSIGFKDKKYDESSYATAIANHLGSNHNLMMVDVAEVLDLVPNLLDVYDEPFADSSALPTMLVSKMAKQNVTVTLSGDGGDETFQGYGMYRWAMRLNNPILHTFRRPIYVASQLMAERYKRSGTLLNYEDKSHLHSHIFSQEQYQFSEQELSEMLIDSSFNFDEINKPLVNSSTGNAAERQAFWDLNYYL